VRLSEDDMRTTLQRLALPAVLAVAALAVAQEPRVFTPNQPPRADEITILNTTVVSLDRPARTVTVRLDRPTRDGVVDRSMTRTFPLAERAALALDTLRRGVAVMLTLRGETVIDARLTTASPAAAQPGTGVISTGGSTTTIGAGGGTVTTGAGGAVPQGGVPPGGAAQGAAVAPQVSPTPEGQTRPPVSPVSVPTPRPVGTPRPVVLPSDPPPTAPPEIFSPAPSPYPGH
jgi:hypothetical protein